MLVSIGPRRAPGDLVDLLLECHDRIRSFLALGQRLATPPFVPSATEIATTAADIKRYFTEAYPLHVADEELELVPRLQGRDRDLDRALAAMHAEHGAHEPAIARLIAACVEANPAAIGAAAAALEADVLPHLELEEQVVFPAVRAHLLADDGIAILSAMRLRRS